MTANGTTGGSMNLMTNFVAVFHKAGRLVRRIFLGGLFVVAAGIVAVATAILGLLVALAALALRFKVQRQGAQTTGRAQPHGPQRVVPVTLEARQTGEGWTVE